jgi:hypothetical protein
MYITVSYIKLTSIITIFLHELPDQRFSLSAYGEQVENIPKVVEGSLLLLCHSPFMYVCMCMCNSSPRCTCTIVADGVL